MFQSDESDMTKQRVTQHARKRKETEKLMRCTAHTILVSAKRQTGKMSRDETRSYLKKPPEMFYEGI